MSTICCRTIYYTVLYNCYTYNCNVKLVTEEDYDAFCLSYMFTYRDFEKGTLGLAWTGDLKNAGGVCEKNGVSLPRVGKRNETNSTVAPPSEITLFRGAFTILGQLPLGEN